MTKLPRLVGRSGNAMQDNGAHVAYLPLSYEILGRST